MPKQGPNGDLRDVKEELNNKHQLLFPKVSVQHHKHLFLSSFLLYTHRVLTL